MHQRQETRLTEEKMRKIAAGATVAGVLLVLFLIVILIVQFVQINVRNAQKRELDEAIARYEELIADGNSLLDIYQSERGLYELALKYGWVNAKN